jgi:hypothetical protein
MNVLEHLWQSYWESYFETLCFSFLHHVVYFHARIVTKLVQFFQSLLLLHFGFLFDAF